MCSEYSFIIINDNTLLSKVYYTEPIYLHHEEYLFTKDALYAPHSNTIRYMYIHVWLQPLATIFENINS